MRGKVFGKLDKGCENYRYRDYARLSRELEQEAGRRGLEFDRYSMYDRAYNRANWGGVFLNNCENDFIGLFEVRFYGQRRFFASDAADACERLVAGEAWEIGARMAGELAKEMER